MHFVCCLWRNSLTDHCQPHWLVRIIGLVGETHWKVSLTLGSIRLIKCCLEFAYSLTEKLLSSLTPRIPIEAQLSCKMDKWIASSVSWGSATVKCVCLVGHENTTIVWFSFLRNCNRSKDWFSMNLGHGTPSTAGVFDMKSIKQISIK